jgi:serine protease Do
MKKNIWMTTAGLAVLTPALIALPGHSTTAASQAQEQNQERAKTKVQRIEIAQDPEVISLLSDEDGPSFLGIEAREVTPENVKEFKLPAERGIVVGRVAPKSPAAKAGLKETDVITEVDGQRVEGSAQFRRMIREIPAGRTVQLTVWRDGHAESLSATLGQAEEMHRSMMNAMPGAFAFRMPEVEMPEMPVVPDFPSTYIDGELGELMPELHPRLGIDAEDISGQLGGYFGAPDGEGVLVRSVNAGSAADKGGLKAGDVITKFNGERIRSLGELREKLSEKSDEKATLGVTRSKTEVTLTIEVPAPAKVKVHAGHRTTI